MFVTKHTHTRMHIHNIGAPKYVRQILADLKAVMHWVARRVGYTNTALSAMERSSREKTKKEATDLNQNVGHIFLTDIHKLL